MSVQWFFDHLQWMAAQLLVVLLTHLKSAADRREALLNSVDTGHR